MPVFLAFDSRNSPKCVHIFGQTTFPLVLRVDRSGVETCRVALAGIDQSAIVQRGLLPRLGSELPLGAE